MEEQEQNREQQPSLRPPEAGSGPRLRGSDSRSGQGKPKKKGLIIGIIIAVAVVIIIIAAASGGSDSNEPAAVGPNGEEVGNSIGDLAPGFSVVDLQGNEVKLSDFAGTPVLVNFWATWCPFCVDELPLFGEIQKEFGDQYVTLAVNRAESESRAKSYTDDLGVTDDLIFVFDKSDRIYDQYGGFAMPVSIFIDSDGVIQDRKQGPLSESELRKKLQSIGIGE